MKRTISLLLAVSMLLPLSNFAQGNGSKYPPLLPKSNNSAFYLTGTRHDTAMPDLSWSPADSGLFFYTAASLLKQEFDRVHDVDSGWINSILRSVHYDANSDDTGEILQSYDNDIKSYTNSSRFQYTYDANHHIITTISFVWNASSGQWDYTNKNDYTYDTNNNLTQLTISYWDPGTSAWIPLQQFQYFYDSNNNQTKEIDLSWDGSVWQNVNQIFNSFDASDNKTSQRIQNWTGSNWQNSTLDTFIYNISNKVISDLVFLYDQPVKKFDINFRKSDYQYDGSNNLALEIISVYTDTSYVPFYEQVFNYDGDGNNTLAQLKLYNNSTGDFDNQDQRVFYWSSSAPTLVSSVQPVINHIKLYPNPAADWITLSFSSPDARTTLLKIVDASGKAVEQIEKHFSKGENVIKTSISQLHAGIYYLVIADGKSALPQAEPFIVIK